MDFVKRGMIYKNFLLCACVALMALGLAACSKDDKKPLPPNSIRKVKGDPKAFVRGASMNGQYASLPAEVFAGEEGKQWEMTISGFQEEAPTSWETFYDQQNSDPDAEPGSEEPRDDQPVVNFDSGYHLQISGNEYILEANENGYSFKFIFTKTEEGAFKFKSLSLPYSEEREDGTIEQASEMDITEMGYSVDVLHYSWSAEKEVFTILLFIAGHGQRLLFNFSFGREDGKSLWEKFGSMLNYRYIFGDDLRFGWDVNKPLELTVCGLGDYPQLLTANREAAAAWNNAINGDLQWTVKAADKCPPFSDVNSQNFWIVKDWIEIVGEAGVHGVTLPRANWRRGEIIDADIYLLQSDILEEIPLQDQDAFLKRFLADKRGYKFLYAVILHEMGHFLGLAHPSFTTDKDIESIMSYNESNNAGILYAYDRNAIKELYAHQVKKKKKTEQAHR